MTTIKISENIEIEQKYDLYQYYMTDLSQYNLDLEFLYARMMGFNPTRIRIKDTWYRAIPLFELARTKSEDGYYRFIYIQINLVSNEYYIGKVNRKQWGAIERYQGSGLLFTKKYKKHAGDFVRYFIAACETQKETEELEASIVDHELLKDDKCLNLVCGGAGTNNHPSLEETRKKLSKNMKEHPERYQAMLEATRNLYCSGNTVHLRKRNASIKSTMSAEEYREMSRERILNWKNSHPEEYKRARENNRESARSDASRKKRRESRKKWIEEHPEEYIENEKKRKAATVSKEANAKRAESIRAFRKNNPELVAAYQKKLTEASVKASSKRVHMLDLDSGDVLMTFDSQHDAARWLVEQGYAKNANCVSSINQVCLKKPCTTGYGYRKKAYGFGWEFADKSISE